MEKAAEHQEPSSKHHAPLVTPDEVDKEHELHEHDDVLALVQQVTPCYSLRRVPSLRGAVQQARGSRV